MVVDEANVDFGAETAIPLISTYPNLLVVQTMSKSRALAGLRVGYAIGDGGLIEALTRVKNSFNSYPLGRPAQAGAIAAFDPGTVAARFRGAAIESRLCFRTPPDPWRGRAGGGTSQAAGAGAPF